MCYKKNIFVLKQGQTVHKTQKDKETQKNISKQIFRQTKNTKQNTNKQKKHTHRQTEKTYTQTNRKNKHRRKEKTKHKQTDTHKWRLQLKCYK